MIRINKRGIALEQVALAILALFLIIILIWIIPGQIKEPFMKLLGLGNFTKTENELAVTETQFKATELQTVANSVNALTCAINSIATGQYPYPGCEPAYDITTQSLTKETVNENDYAQKLGDRILRCYKDYKPIMDSAKILPCCTINPETDGLKIDKGKIQDYIKTLEKAGDKQADDLAGAKILFIDTSKEYEIKLSGNTIKKDSIICGYNKKIILTDDKSNCGLQDTIACEGKDVIKYGNTCLKCGESGTAAQREICCEYKITSNEAAATAQTTGTNYAWKIKEECVRNPTSKVAADNKCPPKKIDINSCTITNFLLPQEIESQAFADSWAKGVGDPEYMIYYETFPNGEEEYWNTDAYSWQPTLMIGGALVSAFTGPGGDIKKIIQGTAKVAKTTGTKAALKEGFTDMADKSIVIKTIRKGSDIYSAVKSARKVGSFELFFASISHGGKISDDLLKKILEKKGGNIDEVINLLNKQKLNSQQLEKVMEFAAQKSVRSKDAAEGLFDASAAEFDKIENAGIATRFSDKINILVSKSPGARKTLTTMDTIIHGATGAAGTTIAAATAKPTLRFTALLGIGWISTQLDSQNEKYRHEGKDALYLNKPVLMEGADKKFDLKEASKYFIGINKDVGQEDRLQRFHLISPCKAELQIKKKGYSISTKDFDINSYDIFDFGAGLTPVKKATVDFNVFGETTLQCPSQPKIYDYNPNDELKPSQECHGALPGVTVGDKECIYVNSFCYLGKRMNKDEFYDGLTDLQDKVAKKGTIDQNLLFKEIHTLLSKTDDGDYRTYYYISELQNEVDGLKQDLNTIYSDSFEKFDDLLDYTNSAELKKEGHNQYNSNSEEFRYRISIEENKLKGGNNELYKKATECIKNYEGCNYIDYFKNFMNYEHEDGINYKSWNWNELDLRFFITISALDCQNASETVSEIKAFNDENAYKFDAPDIEDSINWLTRPIYEHACIISNADGSMRNYGALIPTYMFQETTTFYHVTRPRIITLQSFNDIIIPELKRMDAYKKEDVTKLTSPELMWLKSYLEEKQKVLKNDFNTDKGVMPSEGDINIWIEVEKELAKRNQADPTNAVKDINSLSVQDMTPAAMLNGKMLLFEAIEVDPIIDSSYPYNYCYHGNFPGLDTLKWVNFGASLFMDDIIGTAAGIGCASTGVGAGLAIVCARGAAAITNAGFALSGEMLDQQTKWPKRSASAQQTDYHNQGPAYEMPMYIG